MKLISKIARVFILIDFILIYDVAYKTLHCPKPLCIISDKVDGYIRKYEKTK